MLRGMLDDGNLQQQTWQKFSNVMEPKVRGAWNLHRLTRSEPVEFFLLVFLGSFFARLPRTS